MSKTARVYELITCLVLAIYSLVMIAYAQLNPVTAKVRGMKSYTFPVGVYALMLGICIILIIKNLVNEVRIKKVFSTLTLHERRQLRAEEKEQYVFEPLDRRVIITTALIIAYAAAWNLVGFSLATMAFVTVTAKVLRPATKLETCILVAIATTILIHVVFVKLFAISLPEPLLSAILS